MTARLAAALLIGVLAAARLDAQLQPFHEDNTLRIVLGPFQDEAHQPVTPETIAVSLDTVAVEYGEVAVHLWAATYTVADLRDCTAPIPTPTVGPTPAVPVAPACFDALHATLQTTVPYRLFHVVNRTPSIQDQRVRLTWIYDWHSPAGDQRQGKDWTDLSVQRNDVLH